MTPFQDRTQEEQTSFVGQVIGGNFRIDRLIGSGATGNVYQAEQLSLGKAVALKVLHPHLMGDDKLVKRFQREAKSASRLNHPNSVQIIESGQDRNGTLFIAMELLAGRDLAQVIRDEFPLPVPRIVHIMSQVFAALDEAHAHGLIHRDLKPSNIMLIERRDEPDFVKVCDYGIAKAIVDDTSAPDAQMLTVQGLVCGTPEYMSPEQARGETLDGRTDLYSAAVILYQMTTGDIPFRAATPIGIVSRHLCEAPDVPSGRRAAGAVPQDLDDLILRGLAKSRELRPATAAIFREELEQLLSDGLARRAFSNAQTLSLSGAGGPSSPSGSRHSRAITPAATPVMPVPTPRTSKWPLAIGLGGAAVTLLIAVVISRRLAGPQPPATNVVAAAIEPARAVAATQPPVAPAPPSVPSAIAPAPEPSASATEDRPAAAANREHPSKRKATRPPAHTPATALAAAVPPAHIETPAVTAPAAAPTPVPPPSAVEEKPPALAHGPRDVIAEGEKLLAQGEVAQACRRGEDAKHAAPKLAPVYKFLGKCYMRAGSVAQAKDNYRHYLELNPNASDAVFIESMIK